MTNEKSPDDPYSSFVPFAGEEEEHEDDDVVSRLERVLAKDRRERRCDESTKRMGKFVDDLIHNRLPGLSSSSGADSGKGRTVQPQPSAANKRREQVKKYVLQKWGQTPPEDRPNLTQMAEHTAKNFKGKLFKTSKDGSQVPITLETYKSYIRRLGLHNPDAGAPPKSLRKSG